MDGWVDGWKKKGDKWTWRENDQKELSEEVNYSFLNSWLGLKDCSEERNIFQMGRIIGNVRKKVRESFRGDSDFIWEKVFIQDNIKR